jgi:uncharacterized protein with FMN-binding domain
MSRNLKYLLLTLVVILTFSGYKLIQHSGIQAYKYVENSSVTLDSVEDGKYNGKFTALEYFPLAEVEIHISQGKIKDITIPYLIATPFKGVKLSVSDSIKKTESIQFDAVTGATRSSYFVKAAIHNAIKQKDSDLSTKE